MKPNAEICRDYVARQKAKDPFYIQKLNIKRKQYHSDWYQSIKHRRQEQNNERKLGGPKAWLIHYIKYSKYRARKNGLEHNIQPEDVLIPEHCPILGVKLSYDNSKTRYNSPSLDRVDNSKGYIKGNVKIISHRANSIKSNMTIEDVKRLLRYMENQ